MSIRATAKALIDAIEQDHGLKCSMVVPAADYEKMVRQRKEIAAAAGDMKQDGSDTLRIESEPITGTADITFPDIPMQGTDPVSLHSDAFVRSETLRVVMWGDGTAIVFCWGAETLRLESREERWRKHIGRALNARNLRLGFTPPPELNLKAPARLCAACGADLYGKRPHAQYCSATCRHRASRRSTRLEQKMQGAAA